MLTDRGKLKHEQRVQLSITRKQWLTKMTQNVDLLTASAHSIGRFQRTNQALYKDVGGLGHRLRGFGGLGDKMDTLSYQGTQRRGAIIEFRARQAVLPYNKWEDYAVEMYKFIHELNTGGRQANLDLTAF